MPTMERVLPRFNELTRKDRIRQLDASVLKRMSLPNIARRYGAAESAAEVRYIRNWPRPQLEAVRGLLLHAARENSPITFSWQASRATQVVIGGSGEEIEVVFRSPRPRAGRARAVRTSVS